MKDEAEYVTVYVYTGELRACSRSTNYTVQWPCCSDWCPMAIELVDDASEDGLALNWGPQIGQLTTGVDDVSVTVKNFSPTPANAENRRRVDQALEDVGAVDSLTGEIYDSDFVWKEFLFSVSAWLRESFMSISWFLFDDFSPKDQELFLTIAREVNFRSCTVRSKKYSGRAMVEDRDCTPEPLSPLISSAPSQTSDVSFDEDFQGSDDRPTNSNDSTAKVLLQKHDASISQSQLSLVENYFDISYNRRRKQYVIKALTSDFPPWFSLTSVKSCPLRHLQIFVGDYVEIMLHLPANHQDDGERDFARVKEIRVLEAGRWLLRIAWLYYIGLSWHESNHLQILLWDTVNGIGRFDEENACSQYLFDACESQTVLMCPKRLKFWSQKERALNSHLDRS